MVGNKLFVTSLGAPVIIPVQCHPPQPGPPNCSASFKYLPFYEETETNLLFYFFAAGCKQEAKYKHGHSVQVQDPSTPTEE